MSVITHPLEICEYFRKVVNRISSDAGNRHGAIVMLVSRNPNGSIADIQMASDGDGDRAIAALDFALSKLRAMK